MTTLITVAGSAHGRPIAPSVRRCDASCHRAKGDECKCVCGGRYHGSGDAAARKLMQDVANGVAPFQPAIGGVQLSIELG